MTLQDLIEQQEQSKILDKQKKVADKRETSQSLINKRVMEIEILNYNGNIFEKINLFLLQNGIKWEGGYMMNQIAKRNNNESFAISDYIRAMIYSLLSNQTQWSRIAPNLSKIDSLFFDYDKDEILKCDSKYFLNGILKLKCGNIATRNQMLSLPYNIAILEEIEKEYGTLDDFFRKHNANQLAKVFSSGKWKLKYMGTALAWEFIRNLGVDGAKPDTHMRRIFGSERLGFSKNINATEDEVVEIAKVLSDKYKISQTELDGILWCLCATGYGEVCTATPNCTKCPITNYCMYPSQN